MKHILLILFFFALSANSQNENVERNFLFFYKDEFRSPKKLRIKLVKNSDTIPCRIDKNKIFVPKDNNYNVVVEFKNKKSYVIENVDFSMLKQFPYIIIGIENNMNDFDMISKKNPIFYMHINSATMLEINEYKEMKGICFISFKTQQNFRSTRVTVKSYTKYTQF